MMVKPGQSTLRAQSLALETIRQFSARRVLSLYKVYSDSALKVLGKSVSFVQNYKEKGSIVHQFT